MSDITFVVDMLRMLLMKFHQILFSSFRGEDFLRKCSRTTANDDDGRQVMTKTHMAFDLVS